jgi:hypothetical protein
VNKLAVLLNVENVVITTIGLVAVNACRARHLIFLGKIISAYLAQQLKMQTNALTANIIFIVIPLVDPVKLPTTSCSVVNVKA